jgi:DNA-binding transcriptional LysR family regulator
MDIPWSLLPEMPVLFVIAEECHFGRAAALLNVSQPRISQIVRRAEDIVGYPIFERRPQVRLTPAGEILIQSARQALSDLNAGTSRAADVAAGRSGTVRLGYAPVTMLTRLPHLLTAFREKYPGVALVLHETYSTNLWAGLDVGRFDIIVSREAHVREGVRNHVFLRDNLVAVLPAGHSAASEAELTVSRLRNYDFVVIEAAIAPQWHHSIFSICQSAGFEPRVTQYANDWAATLALVATGLGVSIVSSTLAQLSFPGVVFVPLSEGIGVGAIWVACPDAPQDPAVTLLISELIADASTDSEIR